MDIKCLKSNISRYIKEREVVVSRHIQGLLYDALLGTKRQTTCLIAWTRRLEQQILLIGLPWTDAKIHVGLISHSYGAVNAAEDM